MNKMFALLITLCAVSFFSFGCDSGVCTEDGGFVSGTSDTELKYPCDISSPTGATTMTSGYTGTLSQVSWLAEELAREGFVVLSFTPANIMGMVSGWMQAHVNSISRLKELNNTHATLRGMIDTGKLSTCGHSKGGGGSLYASSRLGGDLKTTVGMAPWEESFTSSDLGRITAATLIQAGSADTLATNTMTRGEYANVGANTKAYFEFSGLSHMAWASATGTTATMLSDNIIAWMRYYMDGDTSYAGALSGASGTSRHEWIDGGGTGGGGGDAGCDE